jgi:N-acetylneuraminate synthase
MVTSIEVGRHSLGHEHPCYVIAEAGVNHNGSVDLAHKLIDEAARAGAHAVKFQTFRASKVASAIAPKAAYQKQTTDAAQSQLDMLKALELSHEAFGALKEHCDRAGITFLSTPFDEESADFLVKLGMRAMKIASGEITNAPFLTHVAKCGLPLILSTGMCRIGEVDDAVRTIDAVTGRGGLILLHCVSNYPAAAADSNLRAMQTMGAAFGVPVGYSDHTLGIEVPLASVALGACVVEKHFTLDRTMQGPDHRASSEPAELRALVDGIRNVQAALGHGRKVPAASEADTAAAARRSITVARALPEGARLSESDFVMRRPGTGLPASLLHHVVGRTLRVPVAEGTMLTLDLLR